jgi:hypothetical protein
MDPADPILWQGDFVGYVLFFAGIVAALLVGGLLWGYLRHAADDFPPEDVTKD